ncbi:unnamed protein product, partial [Prorocentrum cordatum]
RLLVWRNFQGLGHGAEETPSSELRCALLLISGCLSEASVQALAYMGATWQQTAGHSVLPLLFLPPSWLEPPRCQARPSSWHPEIPSAVRQVTVRREQPEMLTRACLFAVALPFLVDAGWFGPPQYVQDACKRWCEEASQDADASDACQRCNAGPEQNPSATERSGYCDREITFPRHYPKLWLEEPSWQGKMQKVEGKTRCWCDTGCPVYKAKSALFCWNECSAVCGAQSLLPLTLV